MKKCVVSLSVFLALAQMATAQLTRTVTDVLGAHLNYGRGCAGCHAPHSGAQGNGTRTMDPQTGDTGLWGVDAGPLYGRTILTGGGKFAEVLPSSMSAGTPDAGGILTCLSCHDGNMAQNAMMRNTLYETLPASYGSQPMPTLIGRAGGGVNAYLSEHPVGLAAKIRCGGSGWDCSISNGEVRMRGTNSSRFVSNYGFFVKPGAFNNQAVVTCLTCHDPHKMDVVNVSNSQVSGLPQGNYATMFFLRGPYNPNDLNPRSNQSSQFCRQCHAELSNEMNGSTAGTVF